MPPLSEMARRTAPVLAAGLTLASAGCGGGGSATTAYANLTRYEASAEAQKLMSQEISDPQSPLYRKSLAVGRIEHGNRDGGAAAWVVRFETLSHKDAGVCMWVWGGKPTPLRQTINYDVDVCPGADIG
jgi:hypothetical protein